MPGRSCAGSSGLWFLVLSEGIPLALFGIGGSKDSDSGGSGQAGSTKAGGFTHNPKKAERFFEHAATYAESGRYDGAIDMYIRGFQLSPDDMTRHEALLDVAKRRKVSGGKPAGFAERKLKGLGDDPIDRMAHAEKIWAMDFTNPALAQAVVDAAVQAAAVHENEDINLNEVIFWMGQMAMESNLASPKPDAKLLLRTRDGFAAAGRYDKAVEAHRRVISMTPNNDKLIEELKDLEAQKYTMERKEANSSLDNLKDAKKQAEIQAEISGGGAGVESLIEKRRAEVDENPEDTDALTKLVDALLKTGEKAHADEAIKRLAAAAESTGQFRFRARAGDIRMKQLAQRCQELAQFVKAAPDDPGYREKYDKATKMRLDFELKEYQTRVKQYPTDLRLKYEFGKRLLLAKMNDEAIGMLQQAATDPKSRSVSHLLLGRAFVAKGWTEEAIQTLNKGYEGHAVKDDATGKDLQYELMAAHQAAAAEGTDPAEHLEKASEYASSLLQSDIGFRDIRERVEAIREAKKAL